MQEINDTEMKDAKCSELDLITDPVNLTIQDVNGKKRDCTVHYDLDPDAKKRKLDEGNAIEDQDSTNMMMLGLNTSDSDSKNAHVTDCKADEDLTDTDGKIRTLDKEPQLSKNQLRKQLKRDKWIANLPAKRKKEKEKLKLKRATMRMNNIELGPSRKALKVNTMSASKCKLRIAIDFSFDDLMADKDIAKCNKQLLRCYSINRRAENPMQFHVTSFSGKSLSDMQKHPGYVNWDLNIHLESYMELFKKDELVYLTSESDNVIRELDDTKVYIIGGLVDHNSEKGLCHKLAVEKGIAHGQLPIGEYLQMKSRKVLAINHVFELMLAVSAGTSWREALLEVLPQRKGAVPKTDEGEESSSGRKEYCEGEASTLDKSDDLSKGERSSPLTV